MIFFEKTGLPSKSDCRGNRTKSGYFFYGLFHEIKFSTSPYKNKQKTDYVDM